MNVFIIFFAVSSFVVPCKHIIFASSSLLESFASLTFSHNAALIPFTLFAAIDIPCPDPHINIPKLFPSLTANPTLVAYIG